MSESVKISMTHKKEIISTTRVIILQRKGKEERKKPNSRRHMISLNYFPFGVTDSQTEALVISL